jgi:two-component system sensor histidine kinase DesK
VATRAGSGSGPGWGLGFRPGPGSGFGPDRGNDTRRLRGRGRWRLFAGVWLLYLLPGFTSAWNDHTGADRWVRLILLVAFCYVYVDLVARAITDEFRWLRWGAPAMLAALALALLGLVGPDALGTVVYVTVSVAVLWPFRVGLPVAVAGTLLVGLSSWLVPSWSGTDTWAVAGSVALGSLAAFGFHALVRRTWELRAAQQEVSRLAAERERMRIARDLHDLLGHSLTAASVKAQLAGRLVGRDDERAAAEIGEVEKLTRQVLADVRAAVAGYREVSLAVELATAREVLGAAGIAADLPGAVDEVPASLRELFGWAVREGVTNAVRHSQASRVTVRVSPSSVAVTDDGRPAPSVGSRAPGSGLAGLAERAAAAGGRLEVGPLPDGGYRLAVTVGAPTAVPGPAPSNSRPTPSNSRPAPSNPPAAPSASGPAPSNPPAAPSASGPAPANSVSAPSTSGPAPSNSAPSASAPSAAAHGDAGAGASTGREGR